jgi:tetratricopeptide (TPR) repeat protein
MDADLEALRRAVADNPGDELAARRYVASLLRSGRADTAREVYRVKFACPKSWADLEPTRERGVSFCSGCQRPVFAVKEPEEARLHVKQGHCIAILEDRAPAAFDRLVAEPALHAASEPRSPCVLVRGSIPEIVPAEVLAKIDAPTAREHGVVPLASSPGKLAVAVAKLDLDVIERLRFQLGIHLEPVLVLDDELRAAIERLYGPAPPPEEYFMGEITVEDPVREVAVDIEPEPRDVPGLRARGIAFSRAKQFLEAVADFTRVLDASGEARDLVRRGMAHACLGEHADALADLGAALEREPANADALEARGTSRFALGDLVGAEEDFTRRLALGARAPSLSGRARVRFLRGERELARADLERADDVDAVAVQPALWLAGLLGDTGRLEAHRDDPGFSGELAGYVLGDVTAPALIEHAATEGSAVERRERLCVARCAVALAHERRGERLPARASYEACVGTRVTWLPEEIWARQRLRAGLTGDRLFL